MEKTLKELKAAYLIATHAYYNTGKPVMTDAAFDKLEAKIRELDPKWKQLKKTGTVVEDKKTEVVLERFMPSLNKRYPEKINAYAHKHEEWLIMNKLDGAALQLTCINGKPKKLVTRGNGERGGDISYLIPYLSIPKQLRTPHKRVEIFRCEGVMDKHVFKKGFASKFENPRNMINGWFNRKKPDPNLKLVSIVVLGVYDKGMVDGHTFAKLNGFEVVESTLFSSKDYATGLSKLLQERRAKSHYEIDGLVLVQANQVFNYETNDKPTWSVAFKENPDAASAVTATVKDIIYQDSRNSRLIPKIEIKPVRINGVTVKHATCHNAQWMIDRGIGPGAVIKIVRSGDVIPKIIAVVKKAKTKLPSVKYTLKGVHFVAVKRSREADINALNKFFGTMGIDFIAKKTIGMLYDAGFTTSLDYLRRWKSKTLVAALRMGGVGNVMSVKINNDFTRALQDGVFLRTLMVASNVFDVGLGDRKLQAIEAFWHSKGDSNALATIVKVKHLSTINALLDVVPGFAGKSIDLVVNGMPEFRKWLHLVLQYVKVRKPEFASAPKLKSRRCAGFKATFTGYRDKTHEQYIVDNGGEIVPFGSKTNILFYKEGGKQSSKVDKARSNPKIQVTTFDIWRSL